MQKPHPAPTALKERIRSLDILRGFALLGILFINIQLFSLPNASFANPLVLGEMSSLDHFSYWFVHVFAELKFMTIFSILFGAGMLLFVNRLAEKEMDGAKIHIRRMMWLLLFGMIHAYFIWFGDILVAYSIIGLIVLLMRKMKDAWKLVLVVFLYFIPMLFFYAVGGFFQTMPESMLEESMAEMLPSAEALAAEIELYQNGSWFEIFIKRAELNINYQVGSFFMLSIWRTTGMMLLGMVLLNQGILSAKKTKLFYTILAVLGIGVGAIISHFGVQEMSEHRWEVIHYFKYGYQYNYFSSIFTSLGYIGLIILIYQLNVLKFLMKGLEAVGRLAFTNYLCQSVICSIIFYSYGFGLFGEFTRFELLFWMIGIWIFQMASSYIWLKYYRMGPLEWLWRYLTYKEKPQLRLSVKSSFR
ncbi:DUF418 domain-containing protein [Marinifilum caeruleilacunae]|uniref:DUF418 domain-containing protein n=1 Tax=Marinifilum caeruleilacunae TaxID=2499076 RepID=A0ABX1WV41_9BACT|nr:DUF418 domain-containing protein [Marinifilum caeruleilacunae]NOU59779.1 DUF418 domain-containing protein [Marinifilum caeruleilacunae]